MITFWSGKGYLLLAAAASKGINVTVVLALTALIAPLLTFLVATRKLSGKISTSEAGDLWSESAAIREDYRERLRDSDAKITRLAERIALLEADNEKLRQENKSLNDQLKTLKGETVA